MDVDTLARKYYKNKLDDKLKNELVKACQPFVNLTVNHMCGGSNWDRDDLKSELNYKLLSNLLDKYTPDHRKFEGILICSLRNTAKNWIIRIEREKAKLKDIIVVSDTSDIPDPYDLEKDYENKDFVNKLRNKLTNPKQMLIFDEMMNGTTSTSQLSKVLNMGTNTIRHHVKLIKLIALELEDE